MNPFCAWTQWRLSAALDGGPLGRSAARHVRGCLRCAERRSRLDAWTAALREGATAGAPLSETAQAQLIDAVRAVAPPTARPYAPRPTQILRPALALLTLATLLAAGSGPLAARVRRHRAVRSFARGGSQVVRLLARVPSVLELPMAAENERLAQDLSRAVRFLTDGLPILGALDMSGIMEEGVGL